MERKHNMTAEEIYRRLYDRHMNKREWCFKEVPINGQGSQRLDAWVIKPGYPAHTIGYEIKVSRSDFLQDNKWQNYLPYCDEFFFLCPQNLISALELPTEAGLIYVMPNKFKTIKRGYKKKAIATEAFLLGLIINRLNPQVFKDREERIQLFKAWMQRDKDSELLGNYCNKKIRERISTLHNTINDLSWKIRTLEDELLLHQDSNEMAKEIKRLKDSVKRQDQRYEALYCGMEKLKRDGNVLIVA